MSMKKITILATAALVIAITGCATNSSVPESKKYTSNISNTENIKKQRKYREPIMPEGDALQLDGFEEGNYFQAIGNSWDEYGIHDLSLSAKLTMNWHSEGTTAGLWKYDAATKNSSKQATFYCDALIKSDWTGYKYMTFTIDNTEAFSINLYLATQTTDAWTLSETPIYTVPSGEHLVVIKLTNDDGTPFISNCQDIKRVMINIDGEHAAGSLMIDNICIVK